MKKFLKNKNVWIVASLFALALVLLFFSFDRRNEPAIDSAALAGMPVLDANSFRLDDLIDYQAQPRSSSSCLPSFSSALAEEAPLTREALEETYTAQGYILVYFSYLSRTGLIALPDAPLEEPEEDIVLPLTQPFQNDDGESMSNVLHLNSRGMFVAQANCDSQDCVYQGEVTLENKETRILGNMIICSPHGLLLELYTREEVIDMILMDQ